MLKNMLLLSIFVFMPFSCNLVNQVMTVSNEDSVHLISCLKHATEFFTIHSSVVFLYEEIIKLNWSHSLLKAIRKPKVLLRKGNVYNLHGFYILFPQFRISYAKLFDNHMHSKSVFLLIWENDVHLNQLITTFEEYWQYQYLNVIGIVNHNTSLKFYSFYPFGESGCGVVGKPVLVDEWITKKRTFKQSLSWFPRRITNFKGCTLKAIGNHQPPDSIMKFENTWTAEGVASKILRISEEYLNFTSTIVSSDLNISLDHMWYHFDKELASISDSVYKKQVDLAFGWYSYASIEIDNLDLTMELGRVSSIDCFGWAVPYRAGKKPPNVTYYIYEFGKKTWYLIIITYCVLSFVFYFIFNRKFALSSLLVYRIYLEQPLNQPKTSRVSFRVLFASFCFYCLVVSAAYKASFGSFITVPSHGKEFTCLNDIITSSLKIFGSPEMKKIVNVTSSGTRMGKIVLQRFKVLKPCSFEDVMMRVIRKRNIAVMSVKRSMYFHAIKEAKRIKVKIPFRFIPGCLIRPHTTHFMFRRGSPLIDSFNVVLNRLFEAGITQYWILHLGANRILPIERLKGRKLKFHFIKEPVYILLVGYIISSLVLLCEITLHKYEKKVSLRM